MSIYHPTVLILASDPDFSREITAHWPHHPAPHSAEPEFVVLDEGFSRHLQASPYDLAIADAGSAENARTRDDAGKVLKKRRNRDLRQALAAAGRPAIVVHSDRSRDFCFIQGTVIDLRREIGPWPEIAGLVGHEILRRRDAESRARDAETACVVAAAEAALGRYMVEMRSNVNNALTTVLGNAELLLQESGLPARVQAQADAIRNMALRLNEVFQRFSSLEKEFNVAARDSNSKAAAHAAGR